MKNLIRIKESRAPSQMAAGGRFAQPGSAAAIGTADPWPQAHKASHLRKADRVQSPEAQARGAPGRGHDGEREDRASPTGR